MPEAGRVDEVVRGELHDALARAMQRVPEFADRRLALGPLTRGTANRNVLVVVPGSAVRWAIPPGRGDVDVFGEWVGSDVAREALWDPDCARLRA